MPPTRKDTTAESGGPKLRLRSLLALVITALALTVGMTANPAVAQTNTCDNTYVFLAVTDAAGRVPPIVPPQDSVLDSRDPGRQITLALGSPYRYLTTGGVVRPNGLAVWSLFKELPSGEAVLIAQVRKVAGGDGTIRPDTPWDAGNLANPGDRLRVQGFWETNAFCTPSRTENVTLGWINVV